MPTKYAAGWPPVGTEDRAWLDGLYWGSGPPGSGPIPTAPRGCLYPPILTSLVTSGLVNYRSPHEELPLRIALFLSGWRDWRREQGRSLKARLKQRYVTVMRWNPAQDPPPGDVAKWVYRERHYTRHERSTPR